MIKIKFKQIFVFLFFIIGLITFSMQLKAQADNSSVKLRAGTFIKVMAREEFSTLTADIDDEIIFINTSDMYVYETNAIPEDTIFFGVVEDVREPVEGRDGAIKIFINKMEEQQTWQSKEKCSPWTVTQLRRTYPMRSQKLLLFTPSHLHP